MWNWIFAAIMAGWLVAYAPAQAQPTLCPGGDDLPPRLEIGLWAQVQPEFANNLRAEPTTSAAIVGQIPPDDVFRVLDGPRCADGYVWWQVDYAGALGWTAEGNPVTADYWLLPLDGQSEAANTASEAALVEPSGCQRPPDDYTRVQVGFYTLNARTLAMLDHAQALYRAEGGRIALRQAIMQGSYNPGGVSASFGTHDGGGAVDLSVRSREDGRVLTDEIAPLLAALRVAGFAAWLRDTDELYKGSPIHIHAIAIGDAELSDAARGQIDGPFGYFLGYNGLPQDSGIPLPDTSGPLVICRWMVDMGFGDRRAAP